MWLVVIVPVVAGLAAIVAAKLTHSPTNAGEPTPFAWLTASNVSVVVIGVFAGAMTFSVGVLEDHDYLTLTLAAISPLTAAAWEQRQREARVYRPHPTRPSPRREPIGRTSGLPHEEAPDQPGSPWSWA